MYDDSKRCVFENVKLPSHHAIQLHMLLQSAAKPYTVLPCSLCKEVAIVVCQPCQALAFSRSDTPAM